MSKPWGRFFRILCPSQKVRTLKFRFEKGHKNLTKPSAGFEFYNSIHISNEMEDFVNFKRGKLSRHFEQNL